MNSHLDDQRTTGHALIADGQSAGPLRRIGAMVYDTLLVVALEIVAIMPFLPFMVAHDRILVAREVGAVAYFYHAWQVVVIALFFGFFWTRKGQTLGMRTWRIHIVTLEGALPTWRDALLRVLFAAVPWLPAFAVLTAADYLAPRKPLLISGLALLSLGVANYFIAWFDPQRRSWHDRFLRTRIVRQK